MMGSRKLGGLVSDSYIIFPHNHKKCPVLGSGADNCFELF
jgi:hypothetical protein